MSIQCRTCAAMIYNPIAKNIFDEDNNEILLNIEVLTGILIKEEQNMPSYICTCCHLDLYHSVAFRERCLRTENSLQSAKNKMTLDKSSSESRIIDEVSWHWSKEQVKDNLIFKNSSQSKSPRTHRKNAKTTRKKQIEIKKQDQNVSSPAKALPPLQKVDTGPMSSEHSQRDSSEGRQSITFEEFTELIAEDVASDFSETELVASLAISPELNNGNDNDNDNDNGIDNDNDIDNDYGQIEPKDKLTNEAVTKKKPAEKVFICDLCGHQSPSGKNLELHILRHKGEKNFECVECGLKHYTKYLLKLHIRVKHQGEKPWVCKYCGQGFYSGTTRLRHERVRHIREFKYECKICGKKYLTKSCLNKHAFLHTGLKPYRCDLCNVAFPRKPGLRIHCRTQQHQKRATEAQDSQLNIIIDPNGSILLPNTTEQDVVV